MSIANAQPWGRDCRAAYAFQRFILIKQYRPAIDGYIIALPAGLGFNDPNHALVELKEETGYTGKIMDVSPVLKTGASLINDNARIVYIEVDEEFTCQSKPRAKIGRCGRYPSLLGH